MVFDSLLEPTHMSFFDLSPGTLVADRYRVEKPNRQGGLSTAHEVIREEDGEHFEIQCFSPGLFEGSNQAREFLAAWQPWDRVESEWVLRLRELIPIGDSALIVVTDLPRGETLRERLKRGVDFDTAEIIRLGTQVLKGLVTIHTSGLVHGDVKPSNIHVEGEGDALRAQLVDGGITPGLWEAKDLGDKTALIGTPYYAPIEQFGGESPDVQSDVYNAATVLFELLAGVLPWEGTSFLEVFQAKLDTAPPSIAKRAPGVEVDPALEQAIVGGLLADRKERYATAAEFLEKLSAQA